MLVRLFFCARQLVGIPDDAACAAAGKHAGLGDELMLLPLIHPAAQAGVLAFAVFADKGHVNVLAPDIFERGLGPVQQLDRTQIDILVKAAADGEQQPVQ